jgi:hypothetical protein
MGITEATKPQCEHDWTPWQYGGPRLNGEVAQQERLCFKCSRYQWRPATAEADNG